MTPEERRRVNDYLAAVDDEISRTEQRGTNLAAWLTVAACLAVVFTVAAGFVMLCADLAAIR